MIENGGRIVTEASKANYVLFEDGVETEIWQKMTESSKDEMNRIIVHPRWIEYCCKQRQLMDHENMIFLSPLPRKTPVKGFQNVGIQFCCYANQLDQFIFTNLAQVYGFEIVNTL